MVDAVTIGFVLVGAIFLLFGATLSSYSVSGLGLAVGGTGGYLVGPSLAGLIGTSVPVATVGMALVGGVLGVVLSFVLLSMAVAALAFVVGSYVGLTVVATAYLDGGTLLQVAVAILVGLVLAGLGMLLTKTMMVALTAFLGAALVSRSLTWTDLTAAHAAVHPEPVLFDVTAPLFLGLFGFGLLAQFGLFRFGYVTKLLGKLPGGRPLRDRAQED